MSEDRGARLREETGPLLMFVLLNMGIALGVFAESFTEFEGSSLRWPVVWAAIVILLEYIVVRVAIAFVRMRDAFPLYFVLLLLSLVNFHLLNDIVAKSLTSILVYSVLTLLVAAVLWKTGFPKPGHRRVLHRIAVLFFVLALGRTTYAYYQMYDMPLIKSKPQDYEIRQKRNIYLFTVDSMVGTEAIREIFKLPTLSYLDTFKKLGFRTQSATSAWDSTRGSLSSTVNLGPMPPGILMKRMLEGSIANPLYDTLHANGYKIQVIHASDHMGVDRGKLEYFQPQPAPFGFCPHAPKFFLFGYCSLRNAGLHAPPVIQSLDDHVAHLRERVAVAGKDRNNPWLTFGHINFPGHTLIFMNYLDMEARDEFIAAYQEKVIQLNMYLNALVGDIKKHDPDAVIVMWGDHGAWLTRGALPNERTYVPHVRVMDDRLLAIDRTNVTVAVYPENFCRDRIRAPYNSKDIALDVLRCLSEN